MATEDLEETGGRALVAASDSALAEVDATVAVEMSKADLDVQIATAHAFPRSMARAIRAVIELATVDQETATECIYSLPRDGKLIVGPSIRLAELVFQQWGNNRVDAMIVAIDRKEGYVEAQAAYHDLETNSASRAKVRRRIKGKTGRLYTDDMILVTGNAACSIAKRNAILAGIPRPIWRQAYQKALDVVRGDARTLGERRVVMLREMVALGLTAAQIYALAGVKGEQDITLDHMVKLGGLYNGLKTGDLSLDELTGRIATEARSLDTAFGPGGAPGPAQGGAAAVADTNLPPASDKRPQAQPQRDTADISTAETMDAKTGEVFDPVGPALIAAVDRAIHQQEQAALDLNVDVGGFASFGAAVSSARSWRDISGAMMAIRATDSWKEAAPDMRANADKTAFARMTGLVAEGAETLKPEDDLQFFSLWLQHAATPIDARPAFQRLIRSPAYQQAPDTAKEQLGRAVVAKEKGEMK